MPPKRKNPAILRSGNAGNSSKSPPSGSGAATPASTSSEPPKPQLFPPGSKTPLALLNERCQKNGWEKPIVEPRRHKNGFTASITLRKRDKKEVSKMHEVKLEPHPWLDKETALEAKHWAATYALHRFANSLPLHRVLPPGPKEYWLSLEAAKKSVEEHRKWEYAEDPFAAKVEVETRQKAKQVRIEKEVAAVEAGEPVAAGRVGKEWQRAPEVKMPLALRDAVEGVVRRHLSLLSESTIDLGVTTANGDLMASSGSSTPSERLSASERAELQDALSRQGFRKGHVSSALSFVSSQPSPSSSSSSSASALQASLARLPPSDAALQYLMLVVPEDDLPSRFRPNSNSQAFVTGARGREEEIQLGEAWKVDRLVKEGGFPRKAVEEIWRSGTCGGREEVAREMLGRQLAGWTGDVWGFEAVKKQVDYLVDGTKAKALKARDEARKSEIEALEAMLGSERVKISKTSIDCPGTVVDISMPPRRSSTKDQLCLRIHYHPHSLYPSSSTLLECPILPPLSILSPSLPIYLRLGLLKLILEGFRPQNDLDDKGWADLVEPGDGGVVYEVVTWLEENWERLTDEEPPDVGEVMKGFLPAVAASEPGPASAPIRKEQLPARPARKDEHGARPLRRNAAVDEKLLVTQRAYLSAPSSQSILSTCRSLPASASRIDFLSLLSSSRVIVVSGETGSGKTTQLPQFVLDEEIERGRGSLCSIVVTQPRRVSAIGVATRVAVERGEDIERKEGLVGYAIRGERRAGPETRLLFATTGVLLRRLATSDPDLRGVSHIFVDEVHERSVDSDLLLLELKQLLSRNPTVRVILMSATANQALFATYFGGAACIQVSGRTFAVEDLYAEDYISHLAYEPSFNARGRGGKSSKDDKDKSARLREEFTALDLQQPKLRVLEGLSKGGRTDEQFVAAVVRHIVRSMASSDNASKAPNGGILVFMSGVAEIRAACDAIASSCGAQVDCLSLHSQLSGVEQRRVFEPPKKGKIKVVVATNIAETSITIPDVVYVVDSGREKQTVFDADLGLTRLAEVNCSRAAAKQRRGRAGRTRPGVCYKLYTRARERDDMPNETKPEILRTPLESLFLQVKAMREADDVHEYLRKALTPPPQAAMDQAVGTLITVGALAADGQHLTALGKHLAQLPIDVRLGKLLIYGTLLGVFEPVLTLSAILSAVKPLFSGGVERRDEVKAARARFATGNSDLLTDVTAYSSFAGVLASQGPTAARRFCEENQLSQSTIREVRMLRQELLRRLRECGFASMHQQPSARSTEAAKGASDRDALMIDELSSRSGSTSLVKSVFMAGLSQLVRVERPQARFERIAGGTVEKDADAKAVKFFDPKIGRVFLHPGSVLFDAANDLKNGFLSYFGRSASGLAGAKVFLRDATEVPIFGVLLFYGGSRPISLDPGGLSLGPPESLIRLRAPLRIGTLCNALRQLLDAVLDRYSDDPSALFIAQERQQRTRPSNGAGKSVNGDAAEVQIIQAVVSLVEGA